MEMMSTACSQTIKLPSRRASEHIAQVSRSVSEPQIEHVEISHGPEQGLRKLFYDRHVALDQMQCQPFGGTAGRCRATFPRVAIRTVIGSGSEAMRHYRIVPSSREKRRFRYIIPADLKARRGFAISVLEISLAWPSAWLAAVDNHILQELGRRGIQRCGSIIDRGDGAIALGHDLDTPRPPLVASTVRKPRAWAWICNGAWLHFP